MVEGAKIIFPCRFYPSHCVLTYYFDKLGLQSASGGQLNIKEDSSRGFSLWSEYF